MGTIENKHSSRETSNRDTRLGYFLRAGEFKVSLWVFHDTLAFDMRAGNVTVDATMLVVYTLQLVQGGRDDTKRESSFNGQNIKLKSKKKNNFNFR